MQASFGEGCSSSSCDIMKTKSTPSVVNDQLELVGARFYNNWDSGCLILTEKGKQVCHLGSLRYIQKFECAHSSTTPVLMLPTIIIPHNFFLPSY